jgi:sugar phosphate permease
LAGCGHILVANRADKAVQEETMALELEAAVMRKVALRFLPLLGLCYCINVLDRFNVSIAALTMNKALGLSATTYGLGAGAFFWSYVLFQMPANAALSRVGARRWITLIAVAWGLCSAGTALATGVVSFVIARFLLGMAEAGFFPGIAFFMTCCFHPVGVAARWGCSLRSEPRPRRPGFRQSAPTRRIVRHRRLAVGVSR